MFGDLPSGNRTADQFVWFGLLKPFRNVTAHETM
jgi:hypothetical protein